MSSARVESSPLRVFGLAEWTAWLDQMAHSLLGMTGSEFEEAFAAGSLGPSGVVKDLSSVLPLIRRLRQANASR